MESTADLDILSSGKSLVYINNLLDDNTDTSLALAYEKMGDLPEVDKSSKKARRKIFERDQGL